MNAVASASLRWTASVVAGVRVTQRSVRSTEIGQMEGVVAVDADVAKDERRPALRVGAQDWVGLGRS